LSEREILTHAGMISHDAAVEKARLEYDRYRALSLDSPSPVEPHFEAAMKDVKQIEKQNLIPAKKVKPKKKAKEK